MARKVSALGCALLLVATACSGGAFDAANGDVDSGAAGAGGSLGTTQSDGMASDSALQIDDDVALSDAQAGKDGPVLLAADGSAVDASKDAAVLDAAALGYCDRSTASFCADFDRGSAVTDGWTSSDVTPGSVLAFNLANFSSPKRSMRSRVPVGSGLNTVVSVVRKGLATTLGRSVLEFDCNVGSIATTPDGWLLQVARVGRNGTDDGVGIYAHSTGTWAVVVGVGTLILAYELPAPPKYGQFVRISLDVVWSPTAGSVHVAFDGVAVLVEDGIVTGVSPATKTIELAVGLADATGASPAADVSYDNVTLSLH